MRIVDDSSNAGRQIVPEDMNFLSLADQETLSAMESILKRMTGAHRNAAIVVSGCEVEFSVTDNKSLYKVSDGVILRDGLLWNLTGIEVEGNVKMPMVYNSKLSILFDRTQVAEPSPVYGMTLELNQSPHKNTSAIVVSTENLPKDADSIVLGLLMKLPVVGQSRGVNDLVVQGTVTENE